MTRQKDTGSISIWTEQSTRATGKRTSSTGKGRKFGLTVLSIKANIIMGKKMATGKCPGRMEVVIKESSVKTIYMGSESTVGMTVGRIPGSGSTTRCMEKVSSSGQTVKVMWVSIVQIKSMAKGFLNGWTDGSTMVGGKMALKLQQVGLNYLTGKSEKEIGSMVS
jgi:hypothetical protein